MLRYPESVAYAFVITALGTPIGSPDAQTSKAAKGALSP
jgi:hypothetical protein